MRKNSSCFLQIEEKKGKGAQELKAKKAGAYPSFLSMKHA